MRAVEDAIAHQVFHGGDLSTNLLELSAVREEMLTPILAESFGMNAAPVGPLRAPSQDILRRVPGELAARHGIFPLDLDDRSLLVAAAEPLSAVVEDDLGFALGLDVRQVIAPLVRVRQAISEHYGMPLERRYLRLVARLDGDGDPSPSIRPSGAGKAPTVTMPRPITIPAPSFGTGVPSSVPEPARTEDIPVTKTPFVAAQTNFVVPVIPKSPALPSDVPPEFCSSPSSVAESAPRSGARAPAEFVPEPIATRTLEVPAPEAHDGRSITGPPTSYRADATRTRVLAGVLRDALRDSPAPIDKAPKSGGPSWRSPRRKGPFTSLMAEHELEAAATSEAVLDAFFAFAQQFFEYSALFVIHGELAEGRDASGPGADRAKVSGIGIPLDLPSTFGRVRATRVPIVGPLAPEGLDAELVCDLGRGQALAGEDDGRESGNRDVDAPRSAALVPLVVRSRVVAVLYGDDGDRGVALSELGDVLALIGLAANALERIALRKKMAAQGRASGAKWPADRMAPGAATLVRVLDLPGVETLASEVPRVASGTTPTPNAPAEPLPESAFPSPEVPPAAEGLDADDTNPGLGSGSTALVAESPNDPVLTSTEESPSERASAPDLKGPRRAALEGTHQRALIGKSTLPLRRGPAPAYEGRGSTPRVASSLGFEPLPATPPPNATAWRSSSPPAAKSSPPRSRTEPPIPREEDESETPNGRLLLAATDATPGLTERISDAGHDPQALIQRFVEGGRGSQAAFQAIVKNGEQLVQLVMARFPGPLRVDRHRARAELPPASQCGPILELVVSIHRPCLPFVSVRTSSQDPDIRFWATHVLGELAYVEAANVLVPRLFDDDSSVRRIARRSAAALVTAGAAGGPILQGLDHIARSLEQPLPHRVLAIETMGEIRSGSMVPSLITVLEDESTDVAETARRALLVLTRQDFGRETLRWKEWWARNAGRHRIEWLMDALMNEQPSIRRAAGDELKLLTKEYFGYYDDLPKRERERAQSLYRAWWDREGRLRFT